MENIKAYSTFALVLIIIIGMIYAKLEEKKAESGIAGIGTIFNKSTAIRGAYNIDYEYYVDGKRLWHTYEVSSYLYRYLEKGEQYVVRYEEENPDNSTLCLNEPYMNQDILYQETSAVAYWPDDLKPDVIEFRYVVDGSEYTRRQDYGDLEIDAYIGKACKVTYQVENPGMGTFIWINEYCKPTPTLARMSQVRNIWKACGLYNKHKKRIKHDTLFSLLWSSFFTS